MFEPTGGIEELLRCMDSVNNLATEIGKRGVGYAVAVELASQFRKRDGVSTPELMSQSLGRALSKSERKMLAGAVREWGRWR
jgi:hypothetical protein